ADVPEATGRPGPGVLLVEDDVPAQVEPAAAVLGRPADAGPAVRAEVPFPRQPLVEQRVLVAGAAPAAHDREVAPQAVLEEGAHLVAERPLVRALPQVHAGRRYLTARQKSTRRSRAGA